MLYEFFARLFEPLFWNEFALFPLQIVAGVHGLIAEAWAGIGAFFLLLFA